MAVGQRNLDVLDAGCGTGLSGPLLRSTARFLAGVDLSSEMLAKARARNVYDELVQAELVAFMESRPLGFDIVNCADTLVYIGALEQVMVAARRCLRRKGVFAFTVEALSEEILIPFKLAMTGRYVHSGSYVRETMESAGFSETECRSVDLRREGGANVRGIFSLDPSLPEAMSARASATPGPASWYTQRSPIGRAQPPRNAHTVVWSNSVSPTGDPANEDTFETVMANPPLRGSYRFR